MRTISLEYLRPGKKTAIYTERLVVDEPDVKILAMDVVGEIRIGSTVVLEPGSVITWFVFPGQWHDVGRFSLANGTFTGWYTNICTPVVMNGDHWTITDLFLDLWIPVAGDAQWLDGDEFDSAVKSGVVDEDLARAARAERKRIDSLVAEAWPPPICRSWAERRS